MAFQGLGEDSLDEPSRSLLVKVRQAGALESVRIGLDDPSRAPRLVLVGVGDEDAELRLLEEEGEGVERTGGAHPGELIGAQIDRWLEVVLMLGADTAVDSVRGNDQVAALEQRHVVDINLEFQRHAQLGRSRLQKPQQRLARTAAEAIAADPHRLALDVDGDIVPVGEIIEDRLVALGIIGLENVEGLIGEYDAEAEGVVGTVSLIDGDLRFGLRFLGQDGEIETSGPAANNRNLHGHFRLSGPRPPRESYVRTGV